MMSPIVQRLVTTFLLLTFAAIGSGSLHRVHALAHEQEDAAAGAAHHEDQTPGPAHDESNCQIHLMLGAPIISAGWVPLLVVLGVFVAFLSQLPTHVVRQFALVRIDCRGPPRR